MEELEAAGIECDGLVKIAKNAHIITEAHMEEEAREQEIGTTRRGNGPAYRDKYARRGIRAEMVPALKDYVVDLYEELHDYPAPLILCEGAQGFGLDIDWGDYPYVTSSHCTTAGALLNGIPATAVRRVWGVAKAYETYVGSKRFHGDGEIFDKLQEEEKYQRLVKKRHSRQKRGLIGLGKQKNTPPFSNSPIRLIFRACNTQSNLVKAVN